MISLIIPVFNEERSLRKLLVRVPRRVEGHEVNALVVSDGSTDESVSVAIALGFPVLELKHNRGKGTAVRAALETIATDAPAVVVLMDGDGQHLPEDLARLVRPVVSNRADVALASRYLGESGRGNTPINRYLVRSGTVAVLSRLLGHRFTDPYCGYRAFAGGVLEDITICGDRYEGELEALFDACRCDLRIVEVPIKRIYGPGTSKMSADGGRFLGRVNAVRQYAATIWRKHREPAPAGSRRRGEREAA